MTLKLHGYWRSTASYRVRIALNLKGLAYDQATYDLRTGEHRGAAYAAVAPHGLVPALETDHGVLIESQAIMEWLEERYPEPPLLPRDPEGRARVRAMSAIVACDIHPLNNVRVLNVLRGAFGRPADEVDGWIGRWIAEGFASLETLVGEGGSAFAHGDAPTLADCCLVPQVYSAERFKVDLAPFPKIRAIVERASQLPAFQAAHPSLQPDADA